MRLASTLAVYISMLVCSRAFGQDAAPAQTVNPPPPPPPAQVGPPVPPPQRYAQYPPTYPPPPPPPAPPPAGVHMHDRAFIRLQLGAGFNSQTTTTGGAEFKVTGGGPSVVLAFGGAVSTNVIIYGALVSTEATDPDITSGGVAVPNVTGDRAGLQGIGPGVAYYLDPANVFISGTLMLAKLVIKDDGGRVRAETGWGGAIEAQIGKEWWVSDNWGLGLAVQGMVGRIKDKGVNTFGETPTWTARALSLLFSATYN